MASPPEVVNPRGHIPGQRVVPIGVDADGNPHVILTDTTGAMIVSGGVSGGGGDLTAAYLVSGAPPSDLPNAVEAAPVATTGAYPDLTSKPTIPADISAAHFITTQAEAGLSAETAIGSIILAPDTHANRPAASIAGRLYFETDTLILFRDTGSVWVAISIQTITTRISHTFVVAGAVAVPSGDTDFINPWFVSVPSGQTAKLVKVRAIINSGTSATVKLQKNGSDITGFTGISVTTTAGNTTPTGVALADDDKIALVVTAVSASPTNMSVTVEIDYTAKVA